MARTVGSRISRVIRSISSGVASAGRVYGPGGAAHRLGLNPTTLYGKMRKHGVRRADEVWK